MKLIQAIVVLSVVALSWSITTDDPATGSSVHDSSSASPQPTSDSGATGTPAPPTETPAPPTETPAPPTETPAPPTETPAPPTETPAPVETSEAIDPNATTTAIPPIPPTTDDSSRTSLNFALTAALLALSAAIIV